MIQRNKQMSGMVFELLFVIILDRDRAWTAPSLRVQQGWGRWSELSCLLPPWLWPHPLPLTPLVSFLSGHPFFLQTSWHHVFYCRSLSNASSPKAPPSLLQAPKMHELERRWSESRKLQSLRPRASWEQDRLEAAPQAVGRAGLLLGLVLPRDADLARGLPCSRDSFSHNNLSTWPEIGLPQLTFTNSATEWDQVPFLSWKDLWERLGLVQLSSGAEGLSLQRGAPRSTMCLEWGCGAGEGGRWDLADKHHSGPGQEDKHSQVSSSGISLLGLCVIKTTIKLVNVSAEHLHAGLCVFTILLHE